MTSEKYKTYSLHLAISFLFIVIISILGVILSWQSYTKMSDVMLHNAEELYTRITQELIYDFKATYGPINSVLLQIRLSPVIKAKSFKSRLAFLPDFVAILESNSSLFIAAIAYQNGDYFGVTSVSSRYVKQKFVVPIDAKYILLYFKKSKTELNFKPGKLYSIFYDSSLKEVSRTSISSPQFDVRIKEWYQQATEQPSATRPLLYSGTHIVGINAMIKTSEPGVVVGFSITLDNLSDTIARHKITPDSEVVLINANGQTFAYKDQHKIIIKNTNNILQMANLTQLGSGVLKKLSEIIEVKQQDLNFEYNGRRWIGSTRIIGKPGGIDLYALIISPVDELLHEAAVIRWNLIVTAFFVLLLFIPIVWFTAKKVSTPMTILAKQAKAISEFDFSEQEKQTSVIKEVSELGAAMEIMKSTISKFINLINTLAGEQDLNALLKKIANEIMLISQSDAVLVYLMDDKDDILKADYLISNMPGKADSYLLLDSLPELSLKDAQELFPDNENHKSRIIELNKNTQNKLQPLLELLSTDKLSCIILSLKNRNNEVIGLLYLAYYQNDEIQQVSNIEFVEALSGFAAVTLESRQLLNMQEELLNSFIQLIAGAIDAKSPYTGGHCQRVPEITLMLAKAACDSNDNKFKEFDLDDKQWKELSIACWLHDCGKVTIPEYVVDKATKLETIYDRIHEVRMRFEVLKRDAQIRCWQQIADGGNKEELLNKLEQQYQTIDNDFTFIAECNIGGEFMDESKIARLNTISEQTWLRTLDDRIGVSWEELKRKSNNETKLPITEKLLVNKSEHIIKRQEVDKMPIDNYWGFKVDTPEYKYNRGELYNLSVQRGTLSEEERYMINSHMIQTIIMLNNLPYPKYLRDVPLIAGSHHETMDGKGYPKRLLMSEQPLTSRMMVIADIFEALTASDRPYKKPKSLNESIRILSFMRNDKHLDADLFDLFLTSGVYLHYAQKFLAPEQIDKVNIKDYLS